MEDENTSLITKNLKLCLSDSSSPSWLRKPKSAKTSVLSLFPALLLCLWTPRHDWQISHEGSYGTCPLSLWATNSSAVKAFKCPPLMISGSSSGILYSFPSYGLTLIQGVSYQTERPCATDFVSLCIILTVFPHEKSHPCFPSLQTESIGYAVSPTTILQHRPATLLVSAFGFHVSRQQPGFPRASYKTHLRWPKFHWQPVNF